MEYTIRAEYRSGRLLVTREITDFTAPITKWDLLSEGERKAYENTPFTSAASGKSECSNCGEELATEADFAKHYIISDVKYFNLGDCPKKSSGRLSR